MARNAEAAATRIAAAGAIAAAAFGASAVKTYTTYGTALGDLAAITGATGKQLDELSNAAKRIGATTTISADQVLTAFKLVGSASPQLLKVNDDLIAVGKSAVDLAQAAGIDLSESAQTLGQALNQFSLPAEYASRIVDTLATASQAGAVEVGRLRESLINVGPIAASLGLTFEETIATIEAYGKVADQGSKAGSQIRAALLNLATSGRSEFNPAIVGITQALTNYEEANLGVTEATKLLTKEGFVAVNNLVKQKDELERLLGAFGRTGSAAEQIALRFNNLGGDVLLLKSITNALQIELAGDFDKALRDTVQETTSLIGVFVAIRNPVQGANEDLGILSFALRSIATAAAVAGFGLDILSIGAAAIGEEIDKNGLDATLGEIGANIASRYDQLAGSAETLIKRYEAIWSNELPEIVRRGLEGSTSFAQASEEQIRQISENVAQTIEQLRRQTAEAEGLTAPDAETAFRTKVEGLGPDAEQTLRDELDRIAQLEREAAILINQEKAQIDAEFREAALTEQALTNEAKAELARQLAETEALIEIEKQDAIRAATGAGELTELEKRQTEIQAQIKATRALVDAEKKAADERIRIDKTLSDAKRNFANNTLAILQGFGIKSEALQKAAAVANAAVVARNAFINIQAGIAEALKLPFPANLAAAAIVAAEGASVMAAISSVRGGGGGGSVGGVAGGVGVGVGALTDEELLADATGTEETEEGRSTRTQVQIIFNGDVTDFDDLATEKLIPAIRDAVNERDIVLISSDSRNGQELAEGLS
jgi:hypothetical protein